MKNRFEVFSLDVYMDEAGCWTENSRTSLGEPFPQKRTQKSVKKRNKNTEISRAAIRRRKRQVR